MVLEAVIYAAGSVAITLVLVGMIVNFLDAN